MADNKIIEIPGGEFAEKYGIKMNAKFLRYDTCEFEVCPDIKHNIYLIDLSRNSQHYTFEHIQSITATKENRPPKMFEVLIGLQKSKLESYTQFCELYRFDGECQSTLKLYNKLLNEYDNFMRLFGDMIENYKIEWHKTVII